ncbi:MAG TPA: non-canonical purine NTP pyrophosphatase, partial [Acidimicrobiales bacterium]|nr:non-canonical purine NTP pyrophosphatase [Acidimicrobiales bacterium]
MAETFVLATANPAKQRELREILAASGLALDLYPRPPWAPEVEETEPTLLGNALLKARALAAATGMPALAEDTGLEVDMLGGKPGVRSARFAGEPPDDKANVTKLLAELATRTGGVESANARQRGVPAGRGARFVTVAVASWPDGHELWAEGTVEGWIAEEPRGDGGFGYDPVFVPLEGDGRTFAQLAAESPAAKHAL